MRLASVAVRTLTMACATVLLAANLVAAQVTLRLLDTRLSEEPSRQVLTEIIDQFMKENPDIKVVLESVRSADMLTRFLVSSEAGAPPDVTYLYGGMLSNAADRGYLMDLGPFLAREQEDILGRFYPMAVEATRYKGKQYALPTIVSIYGFWVNKNHLADAGLSADDPPKTWEEFLEYAKRLTRATGDGRANRWAYAMVGTTRSAVQRLAPWFYTNGVDLVGADSKTVFPQRDAALEAFDFAVALATKHGVVPPGPTSVGAAEMRVYFANELVSMTYDGPYAADFHMRENPNMTRELQTVWPFPAKVKPAEFASVNWLAISSKTQHPEEAWRLVKYLTDREASLYFSLGTGFLSANIAANNDAQILSNPLAVGFVRSMPTGVTFPELPQFPEFTDRIVHAFQEALTGAKTVQDAFAALVADGERMFR